MPEKYVARKEEEEEEEEEERRGRGLDYLFWGGGRCLQVQLLFFFSFSSFWGKNIHPPKPEDLFIGYKRSKFLPGDRGRERECVRGVSFLVFRYGKVQDDRMNG
jgi:hypothetical protein